MNSKELMNLGLTKNESKVYLALLEKGMSSASELIEKTGLHRAVVYDVLGRLMEKGLTSQMLASRKKYFEAASPHRLVELLDEKKKEVELLLPALMDLSNFSEALDVKVYKGKEGIKTVLEDLVRAKPKEWLVLNSGGKTFGVLPFFLTQLQKKRVKEKIFLKALMIDDKESRKRGLAFDDDFTTIKFLPKEMKTPSVINIYGDVVVMYNVKEDNSFAIVIKNKTLSKSFREYFMYLWSKGKS
ncbi:MAG: TrmB family transcriptional regulator [Candidatus Nanoarchaeia archaeon]